MVAMTATTTMMPAAAGARWRGMLEGCVEVSLRRQLLDAPADQAEVTLFDLHVCVQRCEQGYLWRLADEACDSCDTGEPIQDEADACRSAARAFALAIARRS